MGGSGGGIGAGTTTVVPPDVAPVGGTGGNGGRAGLLLVWVAWAVMAVPPASAGRSTPPVETAATAGWCGATVAPAGAVAPAGGQRRQRRCGWQRGTAVRQRRGGRAGGAGGIGAGGAGGFARFCLATAGLAGAVPPVASAPVAMAETRCWSATAATVGQVPVGLLAVPVARAGCYSAKMGCPGRERPNPGQPPMGNLHINWPGRQQTAHIYEIGSRSVGGPGKAAVRVG
ncbi:hypothetical protein RN06_2194 [Mycobacterium tuberculosis variant bovis BCG]|nr:hypothetical protein RN06_2194 [Mycobacterium tuberculosis variant bovis BCG]